MEQTPPPLAIMSLRGGCNNSDPAISLSDDACQVAENVEFDTSTCGQRRLGCTAVTLGTGISSDTAIDAVTWMGRHLPSNDPGVAELWVFGQSLTVSTSILQQRTSTAWTTISPTDAITSTVPYGHNIVGQTFHNKLFMAYKSAQDRLHVWDGTTLRRAGLAPPVAAPSVTDTAGVGTYASVRYFRIRFAALSGSEVLRRSEPSDTTTFTPATGLNTGAIITRPAIVNEGETHWEVEASNNNADFYKITTVAIGTTTYTDTTAASPGYASVTDAILSEDIGSYTVFPSVRYLALDDDRLIGGGSYEDDDLASTLYWSPVNNDPGVGSDERIDLNTNPRISLDGSDGGEITGISQGTTGYIFAFKRSRIYKMLRTGTLNHAYEPFCLTRARGALKGSVITAVDQTGQPCIYFLDQSVGPCRMSSNGLEWCGYDIFKGTWKTVNVDAAVPCHGVYHSDKQQVHWWIAVNGSEYPNAKIILQTNRARKTDAGVRGGWSVVPQGTRLGDAHCSLMHSVNVGTLEDRSITLVPLIGKKYWTVDGVTVRALIQRCDVGNTDAASSTADEDGYYRARVKTKPYAVTTVLNQFAVLVGTILAASQAGSRMMVRLIKDYGEKDPPIEVDVEFTPFSTEATVLRKLEGLGVSGVTVLEVEFGDLRPDLQYDEYWDVEQLVFKVSQGATS